jgi:hypothetical protein
MMKTLGLSEGDPVRLTGASLPKGKLVKIQAQSTDFLEVSDPKAVCVSIPFQLHTETSRQYRSSHFPALTSS